MNSTPAKTHRLQKAALNVTRWVGSTQSIVAHTIVFAISFGIVWAGVLSFDRMLLVLTTVVSLEAIYLAIFIQMTVNQTSASLEEVEQNIDEIQEDIDEIQEDVDELQEDVEEMSEDDKADRDRKLKQKTVLEEIQFGLQELADNLRKAKQLQEESDRFAQQKSAAHAGVQKAKATVRSITPASVTKPVKKPAKAGKKQ